MEAKLTQGLSDFLKVKVIGLLVSVPAKTFSGDFGTVDWRSVIGRLFENAAESLNMMFTDRAGVWV
jgi:hypothetical protein